MVKEDVCLVREDVALVGEVVKLVWGNNGMVGEEFRFVSEEERKVGRMFVWFWIMLDSFGRIYDSLRMMLCWLGRMLGRSLAKNSEF